MEALYCKDLTFSYPGREPVLKNVSFTLPEGTVTLLLGATGCGKSTLLSLLKKEIAPPGKRTGEIRILGKKPEELAAGESAAGVGYVRQHPEEQIVCDKVWHELSFGCENLGIDPREIRRRVGEACAFFGITDWFYKDCATLSGGQKQILNLAAATVLCPRILLLDEPTAQLDPVAAEEFLHLLFRLQRERGMTVLLCEHRTEYLLSRCDRVLCLEEGTVAYEGPPRGLYETELLRKSSLSLPAAMEIARRARRPERPLDIREGREMLANALKGKKPTLPEPEEPAYGSTLLSLSHVGFRYDPRGADILFDLSMTLSEGQFTCLYGANGSGKSTLLSLAGALRLPAEGKVTLFGKKVTEKGNKTLYRGGVALLCQQVTGLFLKESVREELADCGEPLTDFPFDFTPLLSRHPYDLSGGEAELLGLYKALSTGARLLLLDEPTKGLDAGIRETVGRLLSDFCKRGGAVLCATHDTDFGARWATDCGLLFMGELICRENPRIFFENNTCFTTATSRMSRGILSGCITPEQGAALAGEGTEK